MSKSNEESYYSRYIVGSMADAEIRFQLKLEDIENKGFSKMSSESSNETIMFPMSFFGGISKSKSKSNRLEVFLNATERWFSLVDKKTVELGPKVVATPKGYQKVFKHLALSLAESIWARTPAYAEYLPIASGEEEKFLVCLTLAAVKKEYHAVIPDGKEITHFVEIHLTINQYRLVGGDGNSTLEFVKRLFTTME